MPIDVKSSPATPVAEEPRHWQTAVKRGFRLRCPRCGEGHMFHAFLKVNDRCPACGQALDLHKADDAPPYFTILVVAHIIIPLMLVVEQTYSPPEWVHAVLWLPLSLLLALTLLPRAKGALIGLQWALRMHGFGAAEDEPVADPAGELRSAG